VAWPSGQADELVEDRLEPKMPGVREKLLTASDLASLCEVDLKTIHNWVDRGRIPHFRTPGRHLRFRAVDVAEFLRAWGYTVPRELARAMARTVLVVGSKEAFSAAQRALGEGVTLRHDKHAIDALIHAGADPADAFVFDVRSLAAEVEVGSVIEAVHRGCPQAAIAAIADDAADLPPYVARVAKGDAAGLRAAVTAADAEPQPEVARAASGTSR
jgi:excisionase family DNA binding protein